jgi:YD repeat-containing protein
MGLIRSFQQAPIRGESVIGAQLYSHSGEFSPQVFDLEIPARGVSFQFVRKYRSGLNKHLGALGRGWTFTYAKRIEQSGRGILYYDGFGRVHLFAFSEVDGRFRSPDGFYAILAADEAQFQLKQRFGDLFVFEHPASGGRLLAIGDRNGNALRFEYRENDILVTDPFERGIEIKFDQDRVVRLKDYVQRTWQYIYDDNDCLVEVIQPPMHPSDEPPRVRYAYDRDFLLVSITDPKGQTFLKNSYDEQDRIKKQIHGDGTFEFEYSPIGKTAAGAPVYRTRVKLKNGGLLSLTHDEFGHVAERTSPPARYCLRTVME